jgi:hypothetical protein
VNKGVNSTTRDKAHPWGQTSPPQGQTNVITNPAFVCERLQQAFCNIEPPQMAGRENSLSRNETDVLSLLKVTVIMAVDILPSSNNLRGTFNKGRNPNSTSWIFLVRAGTIEILKLEDE